MGLDVDARKCTITIMKKEFPDIEKYRDAIVSLSTRLTKEGFTAMLSLTPDKDGTIIKYALRSSKFNN